MIPWVLLVPYVQSYMKTRYRAPDLATPDQSVYHARAPFSRKKGHFFNGRREFAKLRNKGVIFQTWVCKILKKVKILHVFIFICLFRMFEL